MSHSPAAVSPAASSRRGAWLRGLLMALVTGWLAGCGGPASEPEALDALPEPPPQAVVSEPGRGLADPIEASLDAAGGRISVAGAAVDVAPGTFVAARLGLQPIANTLDEQAGPSVAVTSDVPWYPSLTITLPLALADETSRNLGVAVQQLDGSWRALERVSVDLQAGTIAAVLPVDTLAVLPGGEIRPGIVRRLAVFRPHFMVPRVVTLAPGETATFTPFAAVPEGTVEGCTPLRPPTCWLPVLEPQVLRNRQAGQVHTWVVGPAINGSAAMGRLRDSDPVGGVYTAPAARPVQDRLLLQLRIHPLAPNVMFLPWGPLAVVRIEDPQAAPPN